MVTEEMKILFWNGTGTIKEWSPSGKLAWSTVQKTVGEALQRRRELQKRIPFETGELAAEKRHFRWKVEELEPIVEKGCNYMAFRTAQCGLG
jgi:hypothetical protein